MRLLTAWTGKKGRYLIQYNSSYKLNTAKYLRSKCILLFGPLKSSILSQVIHLSSLILWESCDKHLINVLKHNSSNKHLTYGGPHSFFSTDYIVSNLLFVIYCMFAIPDGSSNRVSTSNKWPEDTRPLGDSLLSCTHAPLPSAFEWWICMSGIHALPSRLSLKNPFSHSWKHSVWSRRFVSLFAFIKIMK